MDDELRDAERRARERGDAASMLAWASALRRAGRDAEAAAAAFEARGLGASREEVAPLAQPRDGSGDALAPWPHVRGDSAGTRRSRVEGPAEKARILFEIDLGAEDAAWGHGPIVLPDGALVVTLDRTERGGSYVKCFSPDGAPRWTVGLRENLSPPAALATGEVVVASPRDAIFLVARTGQESRRAPLVARAAQEEVITWFLPVAWNRSVVLGDRVVAADGTVDELRVKAGKLRGRSAHVGLDGSAYIPAKTYRLDAAAASPGRLPPLVVDPLALHAFGREREHRWTVPIEATEAHVAVGKERVVVRAQSELLFIERTTGRIVERRSSGGTWLALDPHDEPIPFAPFGPPLLAPPVVDAVGRRYAAVARGDLVGLAPDGSPLFAANLGLTPERLTGSLALGAGRIYLLVLGSDRRSIVCFGDA